MTMTQDELVHHGGVGSARFREAEVIVVGVPVMDASVISRLRAMRTECSGRFIMVLDRLDGPDLATVAELGVMAVLWRPEATAERFTAAVQTVARGGIDILAEMQGQQKVDAVKPRRTAGELDSRELDVLRGIAEGLDTTEIALKMRYSERTVKSILYGLISRQAAGARPIDSSDSWSRSRRRP